MHNFSSYLRCPELTATPYLSPPIQSPVTSNRQTTQSGRPSTATSPSIRQQKKKKKRAKRSTTEPTARRNRVEQENAFSRAWHRP